MSVDVYVADHVDAIVSGKRPRPEAPLQEPHAPYLCLAVFSVSAALAEGTLSAVDVRWRGAATVVAAHSGITTVPCAATAAAVVE